MIDLGLWLFGPSAPHRREGERRASVVIESSLHPLEAAEQAENAMIEAAAKIVDGHSENLEARLSLSRAPKPPGEDPKG